MEPSRIAELLDPFLDSAKGQRLATADLQGISIYINMLQRWNARINLTAIRNQEEIVTRHFGESLFTARHLFPKAPAGTGSSPTSRNNSETAERRENTAHGASRGSSVLRDEAPEGRRNALFSLADVGSGAGFPGIPIKLWAPGIKLTLIESNQKKVIFLREVVRALTLTDVDIQNTRAESLVNISFNVVTLRAVERFDAILPVASSLIAPPGRLALLIGQDQLPRAQSTLPALAWPAIIPIPRSESRVLAIATLS